MNDIKTNSTYLAQIENSIEKIQNTNEPTVVSTNLELIRKMINHEFKANCTKVSLVHNRTKSYFFGVQLFPTESQLLSISEKIVDTNNKVQFENCKEFIIELDSKLIYDLDITPREITAAILHEIGHKVYDKDILIRTKFQFLSSLTTIGGATVLIVKKVSPLKFLLYLAIINIFSNTLNDWLLLKEEKNADSFAVKYGYAVELYSLLDKLSKDKMLTAFLVRNDRKKEEKIIMNWSVKNMLNFSLRKAKIKKDLEMQLKEENSEYTKNIIKSQINQINKIKSSPQINSITSDGNSNESTILIESVKSYMEMMSKGKSELEIDEILIEIDRIETYEDKMYVLGRLYRNLAIVNKTIEKIRGGKNDFYNKGINPGKTPESEFVIFKEKVNELIEKVRVKKIKDADYGLFIKNPKGDYEE